MNRRHAAAASVAALSLLLPLAAAGTAAAAPGGPAPTPVTTGATTPGGPGAVDRLPGRIELPRPTGRFAVGYDTLHLVDRSRTDPWAGTGPRELMVTLRYPAERGTGGRTARYLTDEEARLLLASRDLEQAIPVAQLAGTASYGRERARPVDGRYPLVVLSPGFTVHRATLTSLAEDMASRGYVVASVDHAYETVGTAFPGGRVLECLACERVDEEGLPGLRKVSDTRGRDASFLLDRLTGPAPVWRHSRLIDRGRIGVAGHSIGGAGAAAAMVADRRIRAGIDMDGTLFTPIPERGLDGRPFLFLGAEDAVPGAEGTWAEDWRRLDGWKRWITFTGSNHFTFTDVPSIGDQTGVPELKSPLPGARSVELTRTYAAAFFDRHLKGRPGRILDGPTPGNPEVVFQHP
ncbi:alpha/beta hydrolase [Streptomyces sp. NPDC097619]|uniref:alpha/beta hydrolase family protein n=1 Tax=Streptomyces sp. NPDC097619 TaxID=3157228 RepID=UPI00331E935F